MSLAPTVPFLDHRQVAWKGIERARYLVYQRFHYRYPGPIRRLHHRLTVVPAENYFDQRLSGYTLHVKPQGITSRRVSDPFGNRILEFRAPRVDTELSFEVSFTVERTATRTVPVVSEFGSGFDADGFLEPTELTHADARMLEIANRLKGEAEDERKLAASIALWVHEKMRYGFGFTGVGTSAARALTTGRGLCQDYTHLMLALCRTAGLRARYVSGHMLAEGGSHAWAEVLLPTTGGFEVLAFDPTNRRRPDLNYITVAVGRDYRDVAPTSGSYSAPYTGKLTFTKRAGLTGLE